MINFVWLVLLEELDKIIFCLDLGVVFGIGIYFIMELCLELLEMWLGLEFNFEVIIVDIGCGSGILFIGVVLLGVC